jgi:hypothetical protein
MREITNGTPGLPDGCGLDPVAARSTLVRLRRFELAEDDGGRPQRFARTAHGEVVIEHEAR